LFRSWHRGIREMDLVLGRFADAQIAQWSEPELDDYEQLLEIPDQLFFAWVSGAEPVPGEHDTPMFRRLRAFHDSGEAIR
jgi:antitoxin CptB